LLHLKRRFANGLYDKRDGAFLSVKVGYGERNALAFGMRHDDHELAGLSGAGHQRVTDLEHVCHVRVILARDNFESII
jgi:hypothetical protein